MELQVLDGVLRDRQLGGNEVVAQGFEARLLLLLRQPWVHRHIHGLSENRSQVPGRRCHATGFVSRRPPSWAGVGGTCASPGAAPTIVVSFHTMSRTHSVVPTRIRALPEVHNRRRLIGWISLNRLSSTTSTLESSEFATVVA